MLAINRQLMHVGNVFVKDLERPKRVFNYSKVDFSWSNASEPCCMRVSRTSQASSERREKANGKIIHSVSVVVVAAAVCWCCWQLLLVCLLLLGKRIFSPGHLTLPKTRGRTFAPLRKKEGRTLTLQEKKSGRTFAPPWKRVGRTFAPLEKRVSGHLPLPKTRWVGYLPLHIKLQIAGYVIWNICNKIYKIYVQNI